MTIIATAAASTAAPAAAAAAAAFDGSSSGEGTRRRGVPATGSHRQQADCATFLQSAACVQCRHYRCGSQVIRAAATAPTAGRRCRRLCRFAKSTAETAAAVVATAAAAAYISFATDTSGGLCQWHAVELAGDAKPSYSTQCSCR